MVVRFLDYEFDTDTLTSSELLAVQKGTAALSGAPTPWVSLNPWLRVEDAIAILTVLLARHVGAGDAAELVDGLTLADWRAIFPLEGSDGDS